MKTLKVNVEEAARHVYDKARKREGMRHKAWVPGADTYAQRVWRAAVSDLVDYLNGEALKSEKSKPRKAPAKPSKAPTKRGKPVKRGKAPAKRKVAKRGAKRVTR